MTESKGPVSVDALSLWGVWALTHLSLVGKFWAPWLEHMWRHTASGESWDPKGDWSDIQEEVIASEAVTAEVDDEGDALLHWRDDGPIDV